ncbi:MAG TPA: hypothetical protein VHV81_14330 [Steroidobacteraceae bacterium]|nr:hypothetical protein [Steroidobacteraceae bacterium]
MTFTLCIVAVALIGLLFLTSAGRRFSHRRIAGGIVSGAFGVVLLSLCAITVLLAANFVAYQRLSHEQPAGEIQLTRGAQPKLFNAVLTYPNGDHATFELRGDEWQVDARVLKWTAFSNLLGFDAVYRLERISGRYSRAEDETTQPRTVYDLNAPRQIDPWELVHDHHGWIPWVDALYGSATYLPMADGALYAIAVSETGLVSRPLNQAARDAVGSWH